MDDECVLKGCQRIEGDSYEVERFDNELACRTELNRMQHDWPGHLFWCEVYETRTVEKQAVVVTQRDFWVGD